MICRNWAATHPGHDVDEKEHRAGPTLLRDLLIRRGYGQNDDPAWFDQVEQSHLCLASDRVDHHVRRLVEIGEGLVARIDYPFRPETEQIVSRSTEADGSD
jgi:hypothetical protein